MDETKDEFGIEEYHPKILLFENVTNAGEIREKIVNSSLPCAAINPRYVMDSFQILLATQLSLNSQQNNTLKTRSVFSEIVYNMSPNKKITDSLKKFGMAEDHTSIICIVLNDDDMALVCSTVKGDLVKSDHLYFKYFDEMELKKVFKIKNEELTVGTILDAIVNRISTKELVTW